VVKESALTKIVDLSFPLLYYLGVLWLTGFTAYFCTIKICNPKKNEYFVVPGAMCMVIGQIAKKVGCHVIGIAGSDEKTNIY
jgi:Putative NADP-dependent oxidoreductases